MNREHPLGLPEGSVRALITFGIGIVWALVTLRLTDALIAAAIELDVYVAASAVAGGVFAAALAWYFNERKGN